MHVCSEDYHRGVSVCFRTRFRLVKISSNWLLLAYEQLAVLLIKWNPSGFPELFETSEPSSEQRTNNFGP